MVSAKPGHWLLALVAVAGATVARALLNPLLGPTIPYGLFFLAIAVVALSGAFLPALSATVLSALLASALFLEPRHTLRIANREDQIALFLFVVIGFVISLLGKGVHQARVQAVQAAAASNKANKELEQVVRLLDLAPLLVKDLEERITYWSAGCYSLYGYTKEQALGQLSHELLKTSFPQPLEQIRSTLLGTGRWRGEFAHVTADGREIWVRSEWVLWKGGSPPDAILTIDNDITAHKAAQKALQESEEQLRLAALAADIGVWSWTPGTSDVQVSANWRRLFGVASDATITFETWSGALHPDDRNRAVTELQSASGDHRDFNVEYRVVWPDGAVRWLVDRGRAYYDDTGRPVRMAGVNVDITERKRAEEGLVEATTRLELALDSAQLGTFDYRPVTGDVFFDKRTKEIWGLDVGGQIRYAEALERVHAQDRAFLDDSVHRALAPEANGQFQAEYRVIWPDGSIHWIFTKGRVHLENGGTEQRAVRMTGVHQDVTERKRLMEQLEAAVVSAERAKASAEEASRAKDHFLAVLSHELRTPLTPVLAAVSLLQRQQPSQPVKDRLELIRRNVELQARLIDDLLDLTRIVRGKVELDKHPVELRQVIDRAAEVCRPDIDARGLHFGIDYGTDPYIVNAEAARLQQVFWNLIKNSIKFTPYGGCVGIRCRREGDSVVVEVNDSGVGIDAPALEHIFDAFAQASPSVSRHFGGLGLGLAISRAMVEMHGGEVSAYSEGLNEGATFTVRLPLTTADVGSTATGEASSRFATLDRAERRLRILLVEDHGDTAEMMMSVLQLHGHDVKMAGDVAAALRLVEEAGFDLLISDLGLPDGSGLDLMHALRSRGKALPAIALSGYGQDKDIEQSRAAGFAMHLVKPADVDHLLQAIDTVSRA
jgi:PAS domain S-box-containing protein